MSLHATWLWDVRPAAAAAADVVAAVRLNRVAAVRSDVIKSLTSLNRV